MKTLEELGIVKDKLELLEINHKKLNEQYKILFNLSKDLIGVVSIFKNISKNLKEYFIICLENF